MDRNQLPSELRDLIARVAVHPHGLGFLHQGYLDNVAVTLGVHPFAIEAAREYMATPEGRAVLIDEVRRARERVTAAEVSAGGPPIAPHPAGSASAGTDSGKAMGPEDLITEARHHPLGLRFLIDAPPETVAVTFGVHPFIVFRARGLLSSHDPRGATT